MNSYERQQSMQCGILRIDFHIMAKFREMTFHEKISYAF